MKEVALIMSKSKKPIKKAKGVVTYNVVVTCPNCGCGLYLRSFPYVGGEYEHAEDLLGMEVFGTPETAAKWNDFEIEYKCTRCKVPFLLNEIEI
jgi:hypothetical protein